MPKVSQTAKPGLSVKAVSKLSGLTPHTLRAWERRYSVIEPNRTQTGRRLYSMNDVEKLKLLSRLIAQGHSIGNLAPLDLKELEELAGQDREQRARRTKEKGSTQTQDLLRAVQAMDFENLDRLILKARLKSDARRFVLEVVAPLLAELGKMVMQEQVDIGQEHALSAILRNQLGEVLSQVQKTAGWDDSHRGSKPTLLFSTREGDLHEFGILLAAILAGARGFRFRYLGANMPAESLAKAVSAIGTDILVLGSARVDVLGDGDTLHSFMKKLTRELARKNCGLEGIWIGGRCDFEVRNEKMDYPILHAPTLDEFDRRLEQIAPDESTEN